MRWAVCWYEAPAKPTNMSAVPTCTRSLPVRRLPERTSQLAAAATPSFASRDRTMSPRATSDSAATMTNVASGKTHSANQFSRPPTRAPKPAWSPAATWATSTTSAAIPGSVTTDSSRFPAVRR